VNRLRTSVSLQQATGVWTNKFGYDAAASPRVKKLALPNAAYISNTFDVVARLTGTYLKNSGNTILDSAIYGYNKANQRTAFTNASGTYYQFYYDNIGQLKVADSPVNTEDKGYAYDAGWNLAYRTNNGVNSTFTRRWPQPTVLRPDLQQRRVRWERQPHPALQRPLPCLHLRLRR
jgi:YD repeat-containing protein